MLSKKIFSGLFLIIMLVCFSIFIVESYKAQNFHFNNIEESLEEGFPKQKYIRKFYGTVNNILSPFYKDSIIRDKTGYLEGISHIKFDTDWAAKKLAELNNECKNNGVFFAYISYPSKGNPEYNQYYKLYGIDSNIEQLRNNFLNKLSDYHVNVLNIREQLESNGLSRKEIFYKTDHHWNTKSGLFAAHSIATYLNNKGFNVFPNMLTSTKFRYIEYKKSWLGETGRKVTLEWSGCLDDFTYIKPLYETKLSYTVGNTIKRTGDFSILVNEKVYDSLYKKEFDYNTSLHYSYLYDAWDNTIIRNELLPNGAKILIIKDSFSQVVSPFLALACNKLNIWDMRSSYGKDNSLYKYIKDNKFDIVLVAYTDYFTREMYNYY